MKLIKQFALILVSLGLLFSFNAVAAVHKSKAPEAKHMKKAEHKRVDSTAPVDINTANAKQLATLKGIGIKKAAAITAYRDKNGAFKSINDLASVRGISVKSVARLIKQNPDRLKVKARA